MSEAQLLTDIDPNADLLKQINAQEAQCLTSAHTRYCLINGVKIDILDIEAREIPGRDNYWEYYYRTKNTMSFLMSRNLSIVDDVPMLEIIFSKELE